MLADRKITILVGGMCLIVCCVAEADLQSELRAGYMAVQNEQWDEAIEHLDRVLAEVPDHAQTHLLLGRALQGKGDSGKAIVEYRKALDLDGELYQAAFFMGNAYMDRGQWDDAVDAYRRALKIRPDHIRSMQNMGLAYRKMQRPQRAAETWEKALETADEKTKVWLLNNLGVTYVDMFEFERAEAALRRLLKLRPEDTDARVNLGNALYDQGELQNALEQFKRVLEKDARNVSARNGAGLILLSQGKWSEAKQQFELAVQVDNTYAPAWHNLGVVRFNSRDYSGAIEAFRRAVENGHEKFVTYNNLGLAYKERQRAGEGTEGDLRRAKESLQRAAGLRPRDKQLHYNLARIYWEMGDRGQALAEWRAVLDIDPDDELAEYWEERITGRGIEAEREGPVANPNLATAVMTFEAAGGGINLGARETVPQLMEIRFVEARQFPVVERRELEKVMEEKKIAISFGNTEAVEQIGELPIESARQIVVGRIVQRRASRQIYAKMIDVGSGRILKAESVHGTTEESWRALAFELAEKLLGA